MLVTGSGADARTASIPGRASWIMILATLSSSKMRDLAPVSIGALAAAPLWEVWVTPHSCPVVLETGMSQRDGGVG